MGMIRQRATGALLGLAIGDALSWPALFHRGSLLPRWTRSTLREMNEAAEKQNVLKMPLPFSLNEDAAAFDLGPTDDTEWAAFTARILLERGREPQCTEDAWRELARSHESLRASVSIKTALVNLQRGLAPPACGNDNPHFMDDAALPRAVVVGAAFSGDVHAAVQHAAVDASLTNAEDGVWGAQAVAAAVSCACAGGTVEELLGVAAQQLPRDSWIERVVGEAVNVCAETRSVWDAIPQLYALQNREYSYGCVAPETLALALAVVKLTGGDFWMATSAALAFAKSADAVPALTGALCGACGGMPPLSEEWMHAIRCVKGICIPTLAGEEYFVLAERVGALAETHAFRSASKPE